MAQTGSFIPRQSKTPATAHQHKARKIYLFSYVSYVLFFGTLLCVAGLWLYGLQLDRSLEEQKALLATERESFSQGDIERVRELEQRLLIAEALLTKHAAPSKLFTELEEVTTAGVQFSSFDFTRSENGEYALLLEGAADTFNSLIYQREVLRESTDSIFNDARLINISYSSGEESPGQGGEASEPGITFSVSQSLTAGDVPFTGTPAEAPSFERAVTAPPRTENRDAVPEDTGDVNDRFENISG